MQITTLEWANEISWNVDGGTTFPNEASGASGAGGLYTDNTVNDQILDLSVGQHTLNYFDSYGDGWHGGYWTLINPADSTTIAGGPADGLVEGAGGEATFSLGAEGGGSLVGGAQQTITIHIHTLTWANEITWNIDDGQSFGLDPLFADNSDYYESMTLSPGDHSINYYDSYGDGWHGGWWEILPGAVDESSAGGVAPLAGGETDGLVEGAGGSTQFALSESAEDGGGASVIAGSNTQVNVQITTLEWANEISWNVDGGTTFPNEASGASGAGGLYTDNTVNDQILDLSVGQHTLNYFDSYGDGWHGGYWTLINPADSTTIAGGPTDGLVEGAGGEATFSLGAEGGGSLVGGAQQTITIHIHTLTWANEITWNIDDGQSFGLDPLFADNSDYYESMTLSPGDHSINYYDSYGDGWHGGWWEILPGAVDESSAAGVAPLAGGETDGLVEGAGGSTQFVLSSSTPSITGTAGTNAQISVRITTFDWANEISWDIDGGTAFGPYADNSVNEQVLDLSAGDHTLNYFDSYGDGWHGGYWTLINPADNSIVGGGEMDGLVTGAGGSTSFSLADGVTSLVGDQESITVHIHTLTYANEITWNIDDGNMFGIDPAFEEANDYYESMTLSSGEHSINYYDSYGDGWHGGWWEILPGDAQTGNPIAGGERDGLVEGSGGSTQFALGLAVTNNVVANTNVAVHIHTVDWANEITWNFDSG
eukprot:COSAG06_NODE_6728_length_2807_cov_9.005908_2_plen_709_part_01